jgi:signal transduction histidine kinase
MLNQQSKETLALLTSLFDWARSQTGQIGFSPELCNLAQIIGDVKNNLQSAAQQKEITFLPFEASNIQVYADANMLKTVLRNLIANSIKYTNAGGTISVTAESNPKSTEISVIDTGIGMDEQTRQKLFKIESNLTQIGTANEKGHGLGLIICKEIIEKHGGQIHVESKLNRGSRFIITLPNSEGKV